MLNAMRNFLREEEGLEMVEWAIVGALITAAGAGVMSAIGTQVTAAFTTLSTILGNP
jgi:pilus assembly protein Flp/PilA